MRTFPFTTRTFLFPHAEHLKTALRSKIIAAQSCGFLLDGRSPNILIIVRRRDHMEATTLLDIDPNDVAILRCLGQRSSDTYTIPVAILRCLGQRSSDRYTIPVAILRSLGKRPSDRYTIRTLRPFNKLGNPIPGKYKALRGNEIIILQVK